MKIDIPLGVRVYNRKETEEIEYILKKIRKIFERWGYERIILPTFEYYDVHKRGLSKNLREKTFKPIDRTTGDILALRSDFTAQVARYYASLKEKDKPKRYYYLGRIFRYYSPKSNKLWENFQLGLELIGVPRLEAEAEIISIAVMSLRELNIKNYQIDINNIKIYKVLKEILALSEEEYLIFMDIIKQRKKFLFYTDVNQYINDIIPSCKPDKTQISENLKSLQKKINDNVDIKSFIDTILENQFDIESLKELINSVKDYSGLVSALNELIDIYSILEEYEVNENIIFDLGEPREFSYYTGIVFEIFIQDFEKQIGQGGRYDNLMEKYDGSIPAVGFAFNILNIWEYLSSKNLLNIPSKRDFYIIDTSNNKRRAYKIAKKLREKGYNVARDILDRDYRKSLEFAIKEGYKNVILIFEDNEKEICLCKRVDVKNLNNFEECKELSCNEIDCEEIACKKFDIKTFLESIKIKEER
ncbi:MAG: ATP phosphoribosyltransferase regulatory subunit [Persephonella sp.]|nr:MAG: ATP phosphoribosyltransferase regulatory subunit [Persephonella sp.]